MEYEIPSHLAKLAKAVSYCAQLWVAWCVVVAYLGGKLPIPGVVIVAPGGWTSALLFLVIGGPALYIAVRIVTTVVLLLVTHRDRRALCQAAKHTLREDKEHA